jgi:Sulfotransferase family
MVLIKSRKVTDSASPIFIIGAPRSGTTLTARILGRHSRVFMPGETHFFDDIYTRRRKLGNLNNADSVQRVIARLRSLYGRFNEKPDQARIDRLLQTHDIIEELSSCRTYKELFSCFMEIQMRLAGKVRWGNNVPKDIYHIEEIISFYPGAKILICVRDVRDFLISYQNKWRVAEGDNVRRLRALYHPVLTSLLWHSSAKQIALIKDLVPRENIMVIRYENLVQDSQRLLHEICRFIGEGFEKDMLEVDEGNSSFPVNQKGIYALSVGRWRQLLTDEEAHIAQKINRRWLVEFGYTTDQLKINHMKLGYMYATLPYGLWKAIRANKSTRGPFLSYVAKRLLSLW